MRFDANIAASGTISAPFGSFDNLTVSGQPVSTGTGGGAGLDPAQDQDITGNWDFQAGLTKSGVTVATQDDLSQVTTSGFASVVSGTIIRPLGTAHSPLGLWTFDGDLTDSSGNGNTLTVEVGGGDIVRIGPYLSGYSFHNQTILIAADDSAFKITGDVTWQAIVIYAADTVVAATKTIAGQAGPSGDGDDTENFLYRMAINTTESLQYFAESAGGTNIAFTVTEKLNGRARRLQHIAFVRENDQITAYVDGIRYNTSSGLNPPVGGSATRFRIGGDISSGAGANFFTGIITSVKVNDFAFTDDQVRREYESTLATAIIPEEFTTVSGAFTQSLTVSGVPVDITGGGGGGSALTVKEVDGIPSVTDVDTIVVTNGTLTDDGGGQVTISIDAAAGSGGLGQVASSGTIWMPEVAPASGTLFDDEFVQGTAASGTESIWTLWDPGDNQLIFENDESGLRMRNGDNSGEWMGIFQDVPTDGATGKWVAWAYVFMSAAGDLTSGYRKVGIGLFQNADGAPTTTDFQFLGLTSSPGQDWAIERGGYTGYTDTTPSPTDYDKATLNGVHFNGVFLRVIKTNDGVADHTWELAYSFDGVGWKSMTSADPGFDVAQVGIICANGSGTTLYRYGAKFFRIDSLYNGAGIRTRTMRGNWLDPTGGGGGSSFDPSVDQTITGAWDFTNSLTVSGVPVSIGGGTDATVSGIIGKKLGLNHDPVALYLFDDNISDSSGNGLDLSVGAGAERYTNVNGLRSAKFDSTNYFRYTPGSSALEITGDITIQFLLTTDGLVGTSYMISFAGGGDAENVNSLYACRGAAGTENYSWFSESGAGVDASFGGFEASGNQNLHHLTYVRESDIVTLYIDGISRGSSGTLATPTGGTSSFLDVGAFDGGSIYRGTMACLKIVNSALTAAQVYAEYQTTWADAPSSSSGGSSLDESQIALLSQVFGS